MDLLLLKDFFELLDLEKSTHVNVTTYSTHLVKVLCIGYWKEKKKKGVTSPMAIWSHLQRVGVCLQALKYMPKFSHERQKHLLGKGGLSRCFKRARKNKTWRPPGAVTGHGKCKDDEP